MDPSIDWRALPEHVLPLAAIGLVLVVALVGRMLRPVGFSYLDAALLVAVPVLFSDVDVVFHTEGSTTLAYNVAGFLAPALLALKFILQGKAPLVATLGTLGVVTAVSYFSSFAVPSQGVLLYYRIPAAVAILLAVSLRWGAWHQAGPIAYTAGAFGVIIGADAFHIHELMRPDGYAHRIVVGGAGLADGIFLVALLGALGCLVACGLHRSLEAHLASRRAGTEGPAGTPAPVAGPAET